VIRNEDGKNLICTLDHKCSEFICKLDKNRKTPNTFMELSNPERSSCKRFFGGTDKRTIKG
jgi:hypothetical protein